MASVNNLAWLEDDDKPSTTSQQPSASPAKALPEPAVKQPNWFDDDAGTDDTKRTSRRPAKGGEEVSIDAPVAPTRSAPPTAFLERMRAFEQQRQQSQQGTASPTGPTPPKLPAPPADGASRPSPRVARQKQVSSVSPNGSPDAATPSSSRTTPQTRPSESPSVIGTDVGLSDASATKPVSLDEFAPLTDEERRQHSDEIAVWGEDTVARARAPSFQLRTAAIEHIATVFEDKYTSMTNKALNAAFDTIGRLISDSVPKVAVAACGVLESIVAQAFFIQDESIPRLALGLDAACARLKDTNSKVREAAAQLLLQLARHDSIGPVTIVDSICGISRHDSHRLAATLTSLGTTLSDGSDFATTLTSAASTLMKPSQSILGNWREVVHRIELCQTFVRIHPNVCRSCQEGIMALALAGLNSSNSKVRRSAIIFAADVYKVLGPEMESYFSNVTAPATLKLLHEEIQAVCGSAGPQGGKGNDDGSADASGVVEQVLEERADVAAFEASGTVLAAEEQANVQFWRTAFDFASMMCIYSSSWKMRAKVLGRVRAALVAKTTTASSECVSAVLSQMLVIALQDSVPTVLAAAIDLTFVIVDSPLLPPNLLLSFATPLVLLVLKQVGGQQSAASRPWDTVIAMLRNGGRDAPARVASVVTRADAGALSKVVAKVVVPRVEIVSAIVDQASADLDALGVSADEVLVFAVECLRHPQSKVRSAAIELVLAVYRAAGNVVQHHLAGLDGKLLEDIKTRIAAVAKKERSRTAPAHRLATIVAPMADVPSADPSPNGKPRPNTTAPTVTGVEFTRTNGSSLRQRMALWREVQRENEGSEASASPRSPPKPRSVESAPAAAMSDSSPVLRPPAVRKGLVFA